MHHMHLHVYLNLYKHMFPPPAAAGRFPGWREATPGTVGSAEGPQRDLGEDEFLPCAAGNSG